MPIKRFNWLNRNLIGFGITSFFNDFSHEMTTAVLPAFLEQLVGSARTPSILGLMTGTADALSSLMKLWSGFLADRVTKYKFFLVIGYTITPLFVGLIGTAQHVWQIFFCQTAAWLGRGLREPIRDTWLAKITLPSFYGRAFGFQRFCDSMGSIAGPLVAFFALKIVPLRTIFFIAFVPGILSVLALILITQEEEHSATKKQYRSWYTQLKKLPQTFSYFLLVRGIFGISNYSKLLLVYRAQEIFLGEHAFILATGFSILFYLFLNLFRALSELIIGSLSDFMNKKNLLAIFGFGFFALVNTVLLMHPTNYWVWFLLCMSAGISLGTVTALEKSYAATLLPEAVRGTGFGVLQMVNGICYLISSTLVGMLWTAISPEVGFLYAAFLSFIAFLLLII